VTQVRRLVLSDFRSYPALDLPVSGRLVALAGDNGAGKTNLLEALSLFSPGRGLRRAALPELARRDGGGGFSVYAEIAGGEGAEQLGVGFSPAEGGRRCRLNREPVGSAADFAGYLRLLWMTPEHDGLFRGPPGDRRRFLDRLVLAVDTAHGARVATLDKAMRQRNRLLEEERPDARWLTALEREISEVAVAIAAARVETVRRLAALIEARREGLGPFPWAAVDLSGDLEQGLAERTAGDLEDWYREQLELLRRRDRAAGRATVGPGSADLRVRHGPKDVPAGEASTGEQKSLLIGLFLAQAGLVRSMTGLAPVLLLDEVAAHLDERRRQGLYTALDRLDAQVWMTGTDARLFDGLPGQVLAVAEGRVSPLT
jgi:DNA replication and repair protein RecF